MGGYAHAQHHGHHAPGGGHAGSPTDPGMYGGHMGLPPPGTSHSCIEFELRSDNLQLYATLWCTLLYIFSITHLLQSFVAVFHYDTTN
jgi:hypothetical protein